MLYFATSGTSNKKFVTPYVKQVAWRRLAQYYLKGNDIKLEEYCQKNYKRSLKLVCIWLVSKLQIMNSGATTYCIFWVDKQLDELARIITYGDGELAGSNILKNALTM